MKKLLLLLIFAGLSSLAFAQNRSVFNHYHISPLLVNPAAAGFFEQHRVQFHARAQWAGFEDAPTNIGALYSGPVGNTFGIGVGVFSEQAAQLTELRGVLNVAFRFQISENVKLSTGFSTEFKQMSLSNDITSSNLYELDDVVESALDGRRTLDASVGVFSVIHENTYAGLSFSNLVGERLDNLSAGTDDDSFFNYYTFLVGHKVDVRELDFTLEPSLMIRQIQDAPFMVDINVRAGFLEDQLMAGLSYRTLGSLGVLLGTKVSNFRLYYTYDTSFQQFQRYSSGTHEVTVALHFDRKNEKKNPYSKRR